MNRGGIIRIVIWIVIVLILLYFSIGYSYEVFRAEAALIDPSDTHEITVDNEDFTPVVTLLEYGVCNISIFVYWRIRSDSDDKRHTDKIHRSAYHSFMQWHLGGFGIAICRSAGKEIGESL